MAYPILAIAIDMFSPAAYRASSWPESEGPCPDFVEDYGHEAGYIYLALQPLLFRGEQAADAKAVEVLPSAKDYFVAGRRLSPSDVTFADEDLFKRLSPGMVAVPAALPPECSLRLDLQRDDGTVWSTDDRILGTASGTGGSASPFVLDLNAWPEIAAVNFSHPLATTFADLDAGQREQVYVWLGAAVVDLLRQYKAGADAPLTCAQREALLIFEVEKPFATLELMRAHLVEADRGGRMYNVLLNDPAPIQPAGVRLSAPRFKIIDRRAFTSRVQSDIRAGLPEGATHASYLQVWWQAMCELALREPAETWPVPRTESVLATALSRYFGFGERLRWPVPGFDVTGPDNKSFMVPKLPNGSRFETNAASLCELVIRIPVSALQGDAEKLRIKLTVAGASLDDSGKTEPAQRLAWLLREMNALAERWAADRTCHAQARHDERDESGLPLKDANGLVMVQTRSAPCIPIANAPQADSYAIPSVFYDLVDSSARLGRNEGDDGLTLTACPRRALFPEECLAFDQATAGWSTSWGIQGDLHAASVSTLQHSSGRPHVYEFVAARLSDALVTGVADAATASESLRFKTIVEDVLTSSGRYAASLWLPNGNRAIDLTNALVDADGAKSDLHFYILDEDPSSGIGAALAEAGVDNSKPIGAEVVISLRASHPDVAAAKRYLPYNRLNGGGGAAPWMALERAGLSRVSQSVDRWIERFHVEPKATGPSSPSADPVFEHLLNFNKLRVYSRGRSGGFFPITYPDAAVPLQPADPGDYGKGLPWDSGWPWQPPYSYFVAHLYSQENEVQRPDIEGADTSQDRKPETLRYERYANPRRQDWVTGYLEHQYSYRIPLLGTPMTVDARIATDVRNLAGLAARAQGSIAALGQLSSGDEGLSSPLLELRMSSDGRNLEIACRRDYLRAAMSTQRAATRAQGGNPTINVDTFRSIYEAVHDFLAAVVDGQADLVAHLYRFDNQLPRGGLGSGAAPSVPARLHRFMTGRLLLRADEGPGQALVQGLRSLAPPSFAGFQGEVDRLLNAPHDDVFTAVSVDLRHTGWDWKEHGNTSPAPDLQGEVNVVRLGFDIRRSPERVVGEERADGRYIPLTPEKESTAPDWIFNNVGPVLDNAKAELAALLRRPDSANPGSPLFFRRDWLRTQPLEGDVFIEPDPGTTGAAATEPREKRWKLIFGDYAPTVMAPPGRMHEIQRVCELFYIPLAFLPLRLHPALASADEATLFTEFLLKIVGEVLEGRSISAIPLKASGPGAAARDAVQARLRMEEVSQAEGGIGHRLQVLVRAVHNAEDLRLSADPLVVRALASMDSNADRTRQSLRALLSTSPHTYVTARAIGLMLFDQANMRFSRSLHSVQLCKRISQNLQAAQASGLVDVDRFVIPPTPAGEGALILDPLEAARYDSEFELLQNSYTMLPRAAGPYDFPIDLGETVQLTARGGTSGRTGEDLLESRNHFPVPGDDCAVSRAIELDAPHWNPHWSYSVSGSSPRQLYLLPSRRFPLAPVTLQVSVAKSSPDRTVSVSGTSININDLIGTDPQMVFETSVKEALQLIDGSDIVIQSDGAVDDTVWAIDNKSTWLSTHVQSDGWHRIDTFLEHHYFLVESGESANGDDAFANDVFEIDVQVNRAEKRLAASASPPGLAKVLTTSNLLEAFRASQRSSGGFASSDPPSAVSAMSLPVLVESVAFWLCSFPVDMSLIPHDERKARSDFDLLKPAVEPSKTFESIHFQGVYAIAQPRSLDLKGPLLDVPEMSERIGSIVTATTYIPKNAALTVRGQRRILRVTVLADPWSRLQVRIKQVRNQRNVDSGKPDMDAAFAMTSPYSSWSGYAHSEYVVDANVFAMSNVPSSQRRLEVTALALEQWLSVTAGGGKPDIGNLLATRLLALVPGAGAYAGAAYWTHKQMLSPKRRVRAVLRQVQPDRHIRHDGGTRWEGMPGRDLVVPRYVFGVVHADQVDAILIDAAPDVVTAGEPELEVTWLDEASAGPVYRVTWPIRFQRLKNS